MKKAIESPEDIRVTISEMCINDDKLSIQEAETLMEHAVEASIVRNISGKPLHVSKKSGHRSIAHEWSKGRTGKSEHTTFKIPGRGAVDYIYDKEQMEIMLSRNFYTRICYYPNNGFYHADRKPQNGGDLLYFESNSLTSTWKFIRKR